MMPFAKLELIPEGLSRVTPNLKQQTGTHIGITKENLSHHVRDTDRINFNKRGPRGT